MHTQELNKKYQLSFDHSQQINGLSRMYDHVFGYKTDGFFVELGVGECMGKPSNTADLADLGWKGIYVEPHPSHYNECVERHKNNNVTCFECCAGDSHDELQLHGDTTFTNVFEAFDKLGWYPPPGDKPGTLMPPVAVKQKPRPRLILLETRHRDPHFIDRFPDLVDDSLKCLKLLGDNDYRIVYEDNVNTILIDRNNDTLKGAIFQ